MPEQYLTNEDLGELVETNDEWIKTRTGIGKRHVISGDESLTSLAADASNKALEMAGVKAEDLDLIILATSSPDDLFGSACTVRTWGMMDGSPRGRGLVGWMGGIGRED